ncbi:MAG: 6-carboxytetrahydropterin synthase QueD [Candidatus Marinimicrobia bacterium]|jgi:6-pyruvoyltetrahydropterin/6-carboxytetrahydropterin synthase|nr:6-carboxytetrahydropterin synthase QueD [Candidatus Neomarinimicrobiota bacterium]MDP6789317.1 6-carboxytetrahydropterin synthase QueD [Candidatus Neomarinimicrobiota bacterium]MDP7071431.1 6-carboxytetrahydropterin synthase QueD [Candidatus Neomarinimicrobiota bacterium]|tara:strand:- start:113 stop:469 length:357 start_codon:yes stop_codon:yes gene_type:complete
MEIYKEVGFEAAHFLPNLPDGHKCREVHGHSFKVRITVDGRIDNHTGWVIDFADIKQAFDPIMVQLDHSCLNDIRGLENPSSENLAVWIWQKLKPTLPELSGIEVKETCSTGCIYRGE